MKTSALGKLDFKDLGKGLVVAIGGGVIAALEGYATSGTLLTVNWKTIAGVALASGLSYLAKNLFTPAQIISAVK